MYEFYYRNPEVTASPPRKKLILNNSQENQGLNLGL